jgi:hypothetical protein
MIKLPAVLVLAIVSLLLSTSVYAQDGRKPRLFVSDSESWEMAGGFAGSEDGVAGGFGGGARPQTAEIIKTFGERCPEVTVTMNKDRADYVVLLDHEGGKGIVRRDNKYALFNRYGDAIDSGSTRGLGNAVKDACLALMSDWEVNGAVEVPPDS